MPKLTERHVEQVKELLAAGWSNLRIAERFGVGETTVRRFRRRHGLVSPTRAMPLDQTLDMDREVLEAEVRQLRIAARRNRRDEVAEERVLRAIERALEQTPYERTPMAAPPPPDDEAHHAQAVLLSDWHAGEVVDRAQMTGLNEFNFDILRARVSELYRSLLSFKSNRPALTELQLWFLGDIVSGNIHDELRETNEFPVAQQAVMAGHLIADLIDALVPHYPAIRCVGIAGNHGRTRKEHASKNVFDSLDVVAYELAAARVNVPFVVPRSAMHVAEIAGRRILLWHGDGVRSSMPGVPWGGVMRRWNELRKGYADRGILLDGLAVGHFHQFNVAGGGSIYMNGSLIGPNEYSLKNYGSGEPPAQMLLTFDAKRQRPTDVSFLTPTTGVPNASR